MSTMRYRASELAALLGLSAKECGNRAKKLGLPKMRLASGNVYDVTEAQIEALRGRPEAKAPTTIKLNVEVTSNVYDALSWVSTVSGSPISKIINNIVIRKLGE